MSKALTVMSFELTIDKEFAGLCPTSTTEELDLLEASLTAEGCRDPIVTWANHDDAILDGHNRYLICRRENIPFKIKPIKLDSRVECVNWIIDNQLGRRNLTDEQKSFLRGKRELNREKHPGHRTDQTSQTEPRDTNVPRLETIEDVAKETGVTIRTIKRDAEFAKAVETVGKVVGPDAKAEILSGKSKLGKGAVVAAAALPPKKMAAAVATGRVPQAAKPPSGKPKANQFTKLENDIGACLRLTDKIQATSPADKFHRAVIRDLKDAVAGVREWRKAVR